MNPMQYIESLEDARVKLAEASKSIGDSSYTLESVGDWVRTLFDRFAPFRIGDRVVLTRTPEITEEKSHGWLGSKHFLVAGAKARVDAVDCRAGCFKAGLIFDEESWLDREGKRKPVHEKHQFWFSEDSICRV